MLPISRRKKIERRMYFDRIKPSRNETEIPTLPICFDLTSHKLKDPQHVRNQNIIFSALLRWCWAASDSDFFSDTDVSAITYRSYPTPSSGFRQVRPSILCAIAKNRVDCLFVRAYLKAILRQRYKGEIREPLESVRKALPEMKPGEMTDP